MNWKRVTDATPKAISTSKYCSSIVELNMEDCFITDDGIQPLCDSPNCSKIEILNLNNSITQKNNIITDETLKSLAYAKEMSNLKVLELRNTEVSSKGIKNLSVSLSAENIEKLRLSHCS